MENQHQKIKGYRDLSQLEIDLMNEIKTHGTALESLIGKIDHHLLGLAKAAHDGDDQLQQHLWKTEPNQWSAIAKAHLQQGLMALTRAVAQPTNF